MCTSNFWRNGHENRCIIVMQKRRALMANNSSLFRRIASRNRRIVQNSKCNKSHNPKKIKLSLLYAHSSMTASWEIIHRPDFIPFQWSWAWGLVWDVWCYQWSCTLGLVCAFLRVCWPGNNKLQQLFFLVK